MPGPYPQRRADRRLHLEQHPADPSYHGLAEGHYWHGAPHLIGFAYGVDERRVCVRRDMVEEAVATGSGVHGDCAMWVEEDRPQTPEWLCLSYIDADGDVQQLRLRYHHVEGFLQETSRLASFDRREDIAWWESQMGTSDGPDIS